MGRKIKIGRILFILLFGGLFCWAAYYIYLRQSRQYNYFSFAVSDQETAVYIPDIDRIFNKSEDFSGLGLENLHPYLVAGFNKAFANRNFPFNEHFGKTCYISSSQANFAVILHRPELTAEGISDLISQNFDVSTSSTNGKLTIDGKELYFLIFGEYIAVSTEKLTPNPEKPKPDLSNADFTLFTDEHPQGIHHIISHAYHYKVWREDKNNVKGKPISHFSFFERIPMDIDEATFYGSTRLLEDISSLFETDSLSSRDNNLFNWIDQGLICFRKDSFEILIAPQNAERDLKLILEESTLAINNDTSRIPYFNIGSFEIMPFMSEFNWNSIINELDSELKFFTEYLNYNVLANSIPAMRWFISEIQFGNMFFTDENFAEMYEQAIPDKSHYAQFQKDTSENKINWTSYNYQKTEGKVNTKVSISLNSHNNGNIDIYKDFLVEIVPDHITILKDTSLILVNNRRQLVLYDFGGNKYWRLDLSTNLIGEPQIIDIENDGQFEILLFQANQMDLVDLNGQSLPGFPSLLNGNCKGGLAVNYDNKFNYRILVNSGNQILSYNEAGMKVNGWLFEGMRSNLKDPIIYYVAGGKDFIHFGDNSNNQYVLNRRGESRTVKPGTFNSSETSPFLLGDADHSNLRKLGYKNSYIYNYYLLDGAVDSVKLDEAVIPVNIFWDLNRGNPLLLLEERNRLVIFNEFGYKQSEILKPNQQCDFGVMLEKQEPIYVFTDNSQNNIYLLNSSGKMMNPVPIKGTSVLACKNGWLYTFVGSKIIAYKTE